MGWVLTSLGAGLAIILIAGVALVLCKNRTLDINRYFISWQCGIRSIWSICEEWRQRLSWLWAPREEKVGLVKAQHPTAQAVPGIYRKNGSTSQYLLHSDSDLTLDAQGSFTRFEAVDRDLHPPLGTGNTIPPQPLRPAPQSRPISRPRPSPLHAPNAIDCFRLQDSSHCPLTPPPFLSNMPPSHPTEPSVFLFQSQDVNGYEEQMRSKFESYSPFKPDMYAVQNQPDMRPPNFDRRYNIGVHKDREKDLSTIGNSTYRQYNHVDEPTKIRYSVQGAPITEHELNLEYDDHDHFCRGPQPYGSYDIVQRNNTVRQHIKNNSRVLSSDYGLENCPNNKTQLIMESMYRSQNVSRMLQNAQDLSDNMIPKVNNLQNIEMIPFRNSKSAEKNSMENYSLHSSPSKLQGLQRVSQYIQSLPDRSTYEISQNDLFHHDHNELFLHIDSMPSPNEVADSASSPVPPPPPAPPDPSDSESRLRKRSPTTGERIFNALRSVTSQSYIDASEFYKSVLSTSQQVQNFPFTFGGHDQAVNDETLCSLGNMQNVLIDRQSDTNSSDNLKQGSDLYSLELNLTAQRTAEEVYNSLQDPSSSPLFHRDLNQEQHSYLTDPSFTRTSEDIFNSFEQRRKSMEKLNGVQEFIELQTNELSRRKSSHDLYAALEEVQMKRRLSQSLDESYLGYNVGEFMELGLGIRRSSLPEPEPPPDPATLQRAVSFESVCSDTSVTLGDLNEAPVVGHVCVGLEHERWSGRGEGEGDLIVSVLEARDLVTAEAQPAQDTFARVCLLPNRQTHCQTRLYRSSSSPSYQEKFIFSLEGGPVRRTLLIEIFTLEMRLAGEAYLLGEATLRLDPCPRPPATTWLPLISPALPVPQLGELMFSLSYLPTAERLTLVVVKARNLRGTRSFDVKKSGDVIPGDFFVKVYLLQEGKKVHKKRTSIKKGEKSPIFNEAIIFSVPAHALQAVQLRLTVAEVTGDQSTNGTFSVGHVIVGSTTAGRALAHWRQMLAALRRPVAMWHPLRKY
ncbi:uncharacterized protein LOC122507443 isoform X1 [Leptopilina heterotoma]|uniref:uncharacterized protein LOC122507443 isoform X1 n=1 Tax=Leptopilina heterotoma TaxID=63436 RepID=UPI001CAA157B|nr:uncharacterized protein LOC122507443 isoform X1 [Leptopilina heterotoma]XP_043476087.1 uncharacterized protein LOC122507443 isoform X1 [Leptopilina heterotoma]